MIEIEMALDGASMQYGDDVYKTRLPASAVGNDCNRALFYMFRWCKAANFTPKQLRVFHMGDVIEAEKKELLKRAGYVFSQLHDVAISSPHGHLGGKPDGIIVFKDFNVLLEIKSADNSEFNAIVKHGMKKQKPKHWAQICIYGSDLKIPMYLYVLVNKNDQSIHIEYGEIDFEFGEKMRQKADKVIFAKIIPEKVSQSATSTKCKLCSYNPICHSGQPIDKNCRSCKHASPIAGMQWHCALFSDTQGPIPKDFIPGACPSWEPIAK